MKHVSMFYIFLIHQATVKCYLRFLASPLVHLTAGLVTTQIYKEYKMSCHSVLYGHGREVELLLKKLLTQTLLIGAFRQICVFSEHGSAPGVVPALLRSGVALPSWRADAATAVDDLVTAEQHSLCSST